MAFVGPPVLCAAIAKKGEPHRRGLGRRRAPNRLRSA